jgi:hypothetical protein
MTVERMFCVCGVREVNWREVIEREVIEREKTSKERRESLL